MAKFPLGGTGKDFDSKKSRSGVVNLIPEGERSGAYKTARRTEGLTLFATLPLGPVRSNILINNSLAYVVSGSTLYTVTSEGVVATIGVVGGTGRVKMEANSIPGDSQILILNGSGSGYIYSVALGLVAISDVDFFSSSSVTVLNERFWLVRDDTSEFFGSEISDGTAYDPLTFDNAIESPDDLKVCIAKKSAFWAIGSETSEYWQTISDITVPLRRVSGASKEYGIIAIDSLAEVNDTFVFMADDRTIRMAQGTDLVKISDLEFELKVKGNGTTTSPGFTTITDAYGVFIDGPVHSIYCITFPTEGYTWCYDLNTGLSHSRTSGDLGYWRVNSAAKFGSIVIGGDNIDGKLWKLDPSNRTENGAVLRCILTTPTMSFDTDTTIPLIEIDMEVAQTTDPTLDPKMIVYYTKDGGNTYINKGHVSLGKFGRYLTRVPLRGFGRVVRNKDFGLKLEITDPVGVQFYGADIYPSMGM